MRRFFMFALGCLAVFVPTVAVAEDICLPDPSTAFCPTCPTVLKCFTVQDWLNYFYDPINWITM